MFIQVAQNKLRRKETKMIKKLSKYMKGLGLLCLISAAGMIVEAICEMALPSIANLVYNRVSEAAQTGQDIRGYVIKIGLAMFGLAVVGLIGGLATMRASSEVSPRFSYRLRKDMFDKISSFSFKNIDTFSTSSLTTRMTNDVTMLQNTIMMVLRILVRAPALLIVSAFFAFSINWRVSMVLVAVLPLIIIIVALILKFGFPLFRAYFAAAIMPSIPRPPKPPGTMIPSEEPRISAAFSSVRVSESIQSICTSAPMAYPA